MVSEHLMYSLYSLFTMISSEMLFIAVCVFYKFSYGQQANRCRSHGTNTTPYLVKHEPVTLEECVEKVTQQILYLHRYIPNWCCYEHCDTKLSSPYFS